MKVAIQGVAGSFHDIAARRFFETADAPLQLLECETFEQLADAVDSKRADAGMMAIENTLAGSILPNYALIQTYNLSVIGETYLQIRHNLLALRGQTIDDIQTVEAHPMAIIQCSEFLNRHPHIRVVEAFDTAGVAKKISAEKRRGVAAIAGYTAAELYDLEILAERLENNSKNFTRFLAVSRTPNPIDDLCNKASVSFRVSHARGSLADALLSLKQHHINLTKIQSLPVLGMPYEYTIHLDITWEELPDYHAALRDLAERTFELRVFGTYQAGEKNMEALGRARELPKPKLRLQPTTIHIDALPWQAWIAAPPRPIAKDYIIIAGPCSAETEKQTVEAATQISSLGCVNVLRAGIWKPRTRAGGFEGAGVEGLKWLQRAKAATGMMTAVEVANAQHVEDCLRHGVDIVWIGARTTGNPFSVQEIADAVKGTKLGVMVKNPISPDLELWIGAFERLALAGVRKLVAIHRGFATGEKSDLRNAPTWSIPMQFRERLPQVPLICDPSHICGRRDKLALVAQKSLDLGAGGLMIESHPTPDEAWTDAKQQLTPRALGDLLNALSWQAQQDDALSNSDLNRLETLRGAIDRVDEEFLELLAARLNLVRDIGEYKRRHQLDVLQPARWKEVMERRLSLGGKLRLDAAFVAEMFERLHSESLKTQMAIVSSETLDGQMVAAK